MELKEFVAISGMPGIYRIIATRSNGLIVEDLDKKDKKFVPNRQHQFSPLETIGIYTDDDTAELKQVFQNIIEQQDKTPVVSVDAPQAEIQKWFAGVLPNYDRDRVHISDMKKVIRWFTFLQSRDLLKAEEVAATAEEPVAEAEEKPKPKAKAAKKEKS